MGDCEIAVFGAGVVGFNTCLELQRLLRNAHVTVIADKFTKETTSNGAAGLFKPAPYFAGPTPQISQKWIDDSYEYYSNLRNVPNSGIKDVTGYSLSNISYSLVRNPFLEKVAPVYRDLDEDELRTIGCGGWKYGTYMQTLLMECYYFLPWATERFLSNGGTIKHGCLNSFSDVEKFGKFDVIVNCTGLGAKELCADSRLIPIRGQVYKVEAPWLTNFYYNGLDTYIIPGISAATLGGCRNFDSWNTEVDKFDSQSIWERCTHLLPRLTTARVIREWVGLRPHRDVIRVEPEIINGLKVVHNYGHSGYGVLSAPGTARTAANLTIDLLRSTTAKF